MKPFLLLILLSALLYFSCNQSTDPIESNEGLAQKVQTEEELDFDFGLSGKWEISFNYDGWLVEMTFDSMFERWFYPPPGPGWSSRTWNNYGTPVRVPGHYTRTWTGNPFAQTPFPFCTDGDVKYWAWQTYGYPVAVKVIDTFSTGDPSVLTISGVSWITSSACFDNSNSYWSIRVHRHSVSGKWHTDGVNGSVYFINLETSCGVTATQITREDWYIVPEANMSPLYMDMVGKF